MQCPTLSELPAPPSVKTGWPWTEESKRLSDDRRDDTTWPTISVITPSFNQAQFIEETIRSILLQGYPNLEYFIMDGGSSDGSVEIIEKYSPWLSYWASQTDRGQSDAINRGLTLASGEFATWINSDDLLSKNALVEHASRIGFASETVYVGNCTYIDEIGKVLSSHRGRVQSLEDLARLKTVWYSRGHMVQPEVMFPRELYLAVGGLDCNNHFTMDFDLWGKFFLKGAKFQYTDISFGIFREHAKQKTYDMLRQTRSLVETAAKLMHQAQSFPEKTKNEILEDLRVYLKKYETDYWKGSGRLAKLGLPRSLVLPLRRLRALVQNTIGGTNPL